LTIKGPSQDGGLSRYEFEKEISYDEGLSLFALCEPGAIDKVRWIVPYEGHIFEVDEFLGDNEGLVLAEVELKNPNETFVKPDFLGQEVTGDRRFYNSSLTKNPYKKWNV
jgi:CYTH domain-containing protein